MSVRSDAAVCRACGRVDLRANLVPVAGTALAFACPDCVDGGSR